MHEGSSEIPDPQLLLGKDMEERTKNKKRYCFIFDDILLEKMTVIEKYYAYGRHSRVNCFVLTQSFYALRKSSIRMNMNLLVLFKTESKTLRAIYDSYLSGSLPIEEFNKFYKEATNKRFGFITISIDEPIHAGQLRDGISRYYIPEEHAPAARKMMSSITE